jgi:hypothetical protein
LELRKVLSEKDKDKFKDKDKDKEKKIITPKGINKNI